MQPARSFQDLIVWRKAHALVLPPVSCLPLMPTPRTALVIMARHPTVGEVKTRLANEIGAERACALYTAFLRDFDARFARAARTLVWAFHPPERDFAAVVSAGSRCLPQEGADLGARMLACFRRLRGEGFGRVIVIGADVPHVRDEWLDEAEAALDRADVVLGPSEDGGYYLIAMRATHDVFSGIEMSTDAVLEETLARAARANLRVHLLPPTFDIDEAADLARLRDLLRQEEWRRRLPHTTAVLFPPPLPQATGEG